MSSVGVLIRTLDESELIGRCLETLSRQSGGHSLDVLVLDSGSTDDTLEIARAHGARTAEMAPEDFDYSKALNTGIELLDADFIAILSAHAIPLDEQWVGRMLAPFADPRVAGVGSRQQPWPGAPFREVHRLASTFGLEPRTWSAGDTDGLVFSNAASVIRRSCWQELRFTLPAAEDLDWAQRALRAGWKIAYQPEASVYHSHDESPRALARRLIDISRGGTQRELRRSRRRTAREAVGLAVRDARLVGGIDAAPREKLRHLRDVALTAFYYARDFSQVGSTAELRRER